jgi:hypothetical protein
MRPRVPGTPRIRGTEARARRPISPRRTLHLLLRCRAPSPLKTLQDRAVIRVRSAASNLMRSRDTGDVGHGERERWRSALVQS